MVILRSPRLVLRWFTEADAGPVLALLNERSWIENVGDRGVRTLDEAKAWIEGRLVAGCREQGIGFWAVERREDGALIGLAGLTQRAGLPDVDVGYALLPAYWGHGYATEAAAACVTYGREALGLRRILAITTPSNTRSQTVLDAIGLRFTSTVTLPGDPEELSLYAWESDAPPMSDRAAIDALVARFFALFTNRDGQLHKAHALPFFFVRGAVIARGEGDGAEVLDVRGFVAPRAEILSNGRLVGFSEREVESRTEIAGRVAQRWSRYRKSGTLDGVAFEGEGTKMMTLVSTDHGWKIASLAWQDDA